MSNATAEFFAPTLVHAVQLRAGETHYSSFVVLETEKQRMGYKPLPQLRYHCHVTDQRLIFEASMTHAFSAARSVLALAATNPSSSTQPENQVFEIPLEAIATFKLIRTLTLNTFAQIALKSPPAAPNPTDLVFAVSPIPESGNARPNQSCARALVSLGKDLLGETGGFGPMFQSNPEQVAKFKAAIAASDLPVVVDFVAAGCKPCELFEPIVDTVTTQLSGKVNLIKVNIDREPAIPMEYGVDCFPTLALFKEGQMIEKITGTIPEALLAKILRKHCST